MKVVRSLVLATIVVALALAISGVQAASYVAAVTGPTDGSVENNVTVYNVAGGASTVQQTLAVGWGATAVAFDASGNLYVAQRDYFNIGSGPDAIDEYAYNSGTGTWNTNTALVCVVDNHPYRMSTGMAVDASGNIYVGENGSAAGVIYKYTASTNSTTASVFYTLPNTYNGKMDDIRVDAASQNLWVADKNSGIWDFNIATATNTLIADPYGYPGDFGMDISPVNGNVYMAVYSYTGILTANPTTGAFQSFVRAINPDPYMHVPQSMVFGPDWNGDGVKDLYLADSTNSNIQVFDGSNPNNWLGTITTTTNVSNLTAWSSSPVPEPSSLLVMIPGVASLLGLIVRKRNIS